MASGDRFDRLDALRGAAIVWMAAFHFCFDLNYFRVIRQNFYTDPVWTLQRAAIVSLFLFCAGLSQAVACSQSTSCLLRLIPVPGGPQQRPRPRQA